MTHGKPHPEPFLRAAELLGVDPLRCCVIEDGIPGIEAAKAAHMPSFLITREYLAQWPEF